MKLYLSKDSEKAQPIKDKMTDAMWQLVKVDFSDTNQLHLPNGRVITENLEIVKYLASISPKLTTQLDNARKAAQKAYNEAKETGKIKVDVAIRDHRRSICSQCPYQKSILFGKTCTQCGCLVRAKTILATETCPIGKW